MRMIHPGEVVRVEYLDALGITEKTAHDAGDRIIETIEPLKMAPNQR